MTKNMSTLDRALRALVLAPLAVVAAIAVGAGSPAGILLLAVAAIMLATGAIGYCPLYGVLHIHTGGRRPLHH